MQYWTYLKYYALDSLERCLKTGAQAALTTFFGNSTQLVSLDTRTIEVVIGGAMIASLLTSILSLRTISSDASYPSASLLPPPPAGAYLPTNKT